MLACTLVTQRAARAGVHIIGATSAILLLTIVAASLTNKPIPPTPTSPSAQAACLLDGFDGLTSSRACNLAYLLGATSLFFNVLVVSAVALAAAGVRLPVVFETVINAFLSLFWLGGGSAIAYFVLEANKGGWTGAAARAAVVAVAFFLGVVFLVAGWTAAVAACVAQSQHAGKDDDREVGAEIPHAQQAYL